MLFLSPDRGGGLLEGLVVFPRQPSSNNRLLGVGISGSKQLAGETPTARSRGSVAALRSSCGILACVAPSWGESCTSSYCLLRFPSWCGNIWGPLFFSCETSLGDMYRSVCLACVGVLVIMHATEDQTPQRISP